MQKGADTDIETKVEPDPGGKPACSVGNDGKNNPWWLVAEQAGLIGLFVDAKDLNASDFYEKYGFVPIPDSPLQLFLPLATMLKALPKVD